MAANRKLTVSQVSRFKKLAASNGGSVTQEMCEKFGITHETARRIVLGKSYSEVEPRGPVRRLRWKRSPPMTPRLAAKIRRLHREGYTFKQISKEVSRKVSAVRDVIMRRRKNWGDK